MPPVCPLRKFNTWRLIPSCFAEAEDSVLAPLCDSDAMLRDLFDLYNATNARLRGEAGQAPGITLAELVAGVPHASIINAAYTYPRPEGSRFNDGQRGAWYCGFDVDTALAEVSFHKAVEYQEINRFDDSVRYQALLADFNAPFHDLRGSSEHAAALAPDSYVAAQTLAATLLASGALGVIYPSVRHSGGTNLACFRPALVGNVRKGPRYRLTWAGSPIPTVELL